MKVGVCGFFWWWESNLNKKHCVLLSIHLHYRTVLHAVLQQHLDLDKGDWRSCGGDLKLGDAVPVCPGRAGQSAVRPVPGFSPLGSTTHGSTCWGR